MGFFVKNVENVQGDERDLIIFSTTFGRNSQGTFRRNFGVLSQSGGERRLNVAVTRARRKIVILTSMPIDEISTMLANGSPPQQPRDYLQGYLAYARALASGQHDTARALLHQSANGGSSTPRDAPNVEDGFTASVAEFIRSRGWMPTPANDESAFDIDFAIRHPATGTFGIGIECEAPRHL
jgi:primosomal replication protein N''